MNKIFNLTFLLCTALFVFSCSTNNTQKDSNQDIKNKDVVNKTYEYHLENGLTLLVTPDHRAPVVISQVWYKIGSIYEPKGLTGISHMLEHMMFKGTTKFKPGEIEEIVLNNGGQQNAFTSHDYTAYYQYWGADKLEESFDIESSRMSDLTLNENLFIKEKEVVKEERRMRIEDNPQGYAYETLIDLAYNPNPMHHPVIGWMNDIEDYKLADLDKWYTSYYAPNNATIIVVGDVNPENVYNLVSKYFSHIPSSNKIPTKPKKINLINSGYKNKKIERPNVQVPTLLMAYTTPSLITAKDKWEPYALAVLDTIIADTNSSRLRKELVRKDELAISISSNYDPFSISQSLLTITALPNNGVKPQELQEKIIIQLNDIKKTGITQKELTRIKNTIIADKVYALDSIPTQANMLGSVVSIGLPKNTIEEYLSALTKVTASQVKEVANKYLNTDNLTVVELYHEQQPEGEI
jgi:zinc protease